MTPAAETTSQGGWRTLAGSLWWNPWIRRLTFAVLAVEVVATSVIPAFQGSFELVKQHAAADAAAVRFEAEWRLARETLTSEIAAAKAAEEKFRSEAQALAYQVEIKRADSRIMIAKARNATQLQKGQADRAIYDNDLKRSALHSMMVTYFGDCRGKDAYAKLDNASGGRC